MKEPKPAEKRKGDHLFKKGQKRLPNAGRKKGVPNKRTVAVAEALNEVFAEVGGIDFLKKFAETNPEEFLKLWIRLLPKEINADLTSNGNTIGEKTMTPEEALAMMKEFHEKAKAE